ncbi:MEC2-like protein [Mya arenaria]|uniref:MEC2-like protein n=1 Tax=Mya arenaria TaxID=6604 RepID=A0ABY7G8K1_MYAAR|nr:MEC2-like protein [Mya arenaria]
MDGQGGYQRTEPYPAQTGPRKTHGGDRAVEQDGDIGCCGYILMGFSILIMIMFFPFSLFCALKILSRDSVTVAVDAVIYAHVFDVTTSLIKVQDAQCSTRLLAATTLRTILGTKQLSEILADREGIAKQMQVILAEGEKKASRSLKEAADIMSESPAAMQIRYLQTLNSIAAEQNSTIIFPLPIDMLSSGVSRMSSGGRTESKGSLSRSMRKTDTNPINEELVKLERSEEYPVIISRPVAERLNSGTPEAAVYYPPPYLPDSPHQEPAWDQTVEDSTW